MKLKKLAIFLLTGAVAASVFSFAACSSGGSDSTNDDPKNTEETENPSSKEENNTPTEIEDPTGYDYIATFYLNDGTESQYAKVGFNSGALWTSIKGQVTGTPTRSGYEFAGWYKDATCTEQYGTLDTFTGAVSVYAYWKQVATLEAEWANIDPDDATSYTNYSNNDTTGRDIIRKDDTENLTASNGYYVDGLWMPSCYLAFEFTVSAETTATITMRLSTKYGSTITDNEDDVCLLVNPDITGISTYEELLEQQKYDQKINLPLNIVSAEMASKTKDFENYAVSQTVTLKAGKNVIWLYINNDTKGTGGTMYATAPIVDCMYLTSSATITQIKYNENLSK